jgi:acyl-coenzyme A synthetase/AMP-(fatty) acid ligase
LLNHSLVFEERLVLETAAALPLLELYSPADAIAFRQGAAVSREAFLAGVCQTAEGLPDGRYAINLCEDRYLFMVGFGAALLKGQTNLLPPVQLGGEIQRIASGYADSYCLVDRPHTLPLRQHRLDKIDTAQLSAGYRSGRVPTIDSEHVAAIAFTSGSTGQAKPNRKRWRSLVIGARLAERRFGFARGHSIVATVPPQHMYGLETSVLLPLATRVSVCCERPFFPEDVRRALASVPVPRALITTPVHLKTCVRAKLRWPETSLVISATAPLSSALAGEAERVFGCSVHEIYGCTEGGSLASRHTVDETLWRLYDGLTLHETNGVHCVKGGHLAEEVGLNDILRPRDAVRFELLGRHDDLVNIAGKRASLADLNHKLNEIEGVEDGVFILADEDDTKITRLSALVVAPTLDTRTIMAALAERLDPVFMPRPLCKTARLPRTAAGKLPRHALLELLARARCRIASEG